MHDNRMGAYYDLVENNTLEHIQMQTEALFLNWQS
jgi:hypothetical protein